MDAIIDANEETGVFSSFSLYILLVAGSRLRLKRSAGIIRDLSPIMDCMNLFGYFSAQQVYQKTFL